MKIGIVGSRDFSDYSVLVSHIVEVINIRDITAIVSGGAYGADSLGAKFGKEYGIPVEVFLPDWQTHGKAAGFIRNSEIVNNSDMIIAFWDMESRGTKDTISKAQKKDVPVKVVAYANDPILSFYR